MSDNVHMHTHVQYLHGFVELLRKVSRFVSHTLHCRENDMESIDKEHGVTCACMFRHDSVSPCLSPSLSFFLSAFVSLPAYVTLSFSPFALSLSDLVPLPDYVSLSLSLPLPLYLLMLPCLSLCLCLSLSLSLSHSVSLSLSLSLSLSFSLSPSLSLSLFLLLSLSFCSCPSTCLCYSFFLSLSLADTNTHTYGKHSFLQVSRHLA